MSNQKFTPSWHLSALASLGLFRYKHGSCQTATCGPSNLLIRSSFCLFFGCWKDMVEDEAPLKIVMEDFHQWLQSQDLLNKNKFAVVTCGDWDLKQLLPHQFHHTGQVIPAYFKSWINIKMVRKLFPFFPIIFWMSNSRDDVKYKTISDNIETTKFPVVVDICRVHWSLSP